MAVYMAKCDFQYDSNLPTDAMTITPHFFGDDAQALADRLKANFLAALYIGPSTPFKIRIYDAEKPPPSYPLAETINGTGNKAYGSVPREVAICLSYYATWNRPRYRGRLYLPAAWVGSPIGHRPTAGQMTTALNFKDVLNQGHVQGTYWCLWSKTDRAARGVSDAWVDDEWDVVRSRGLVRTTRQTGEVVPTP